MLYQQTAILLIPFLGTSLGSAMVFFTKNKINEKIPEIFTRFCLGSNDSRIGVVADYSVC